MNRCCFTAFRSQSGIHFPVAAEAQIKMANKDCKMVLSGKTLQGTVYVAVPLQPSSCLFPMNRDKSCTPGKGTG
jgi:hypothetical protein